MKNTYFHLFAELPEHEIMPGFKARLVHTGSMTLALWSIDEGAVLPRHQHHHEQITHVLEGEFSLTVNERTQICKAGSLATIPPHIPHEGQALTRVVLLDIFRPERTDFPRG